MHLADLSGHPTVVALFYSSCHVACPITVRKLKQIESALPDSLRAKARFLLVTMDPEGDTPRALRAFRRDQQLSGRWTLLRGSLPSTAGLAGLLGVAYHKDAYRLTHSYEVTVLDAAGRIAYQDHRLHHDPGDLVRAMETCLQP